MTNQNNHPNNDTDPNHDECEHCASTAKALTNQNNEFGKSPVKLSSPTQIWIDDVNQNNELDKILTELAEDCAESYAQHGYYKAYEYAEKAKQAIQALYAPKWVKGTFAKADDVDIEVEPVEKVNKTPNAVDLTKPEVNLIDIASPTMTPEASKVVSDAIERSAEVMNKKPVENGELRETILSILGIVDRTSGNRPEQIATLEQELTAHTNAEIAKVLDRLESTAVYAEYDKAEDDVICGDVVPLDAIQAERAKLKEVK